MYLIDAITQVLQQYFLLLLLQSGAAPPFQLSMLLRSIAIVESEINSSIPFWGWVLILGLLIHGRAIRDTGRHRLGSQYWNLVLPFFFVCRSQWMLLIALDALESSLYSFG